MSVLTCTPDAAPASAAQAVEAGRSAASLGGKAAALLRLHEAGFNVPDFDVSPTDLVATLRRLRLPVAVRSSATVEDGFQHSFAGQFRSYLNLRSIDEVEAAVQCVRDSVHESAAQQYCRSRGIDPAEVHMHVIVQRMVQPELAGVAFTVNPATGEEQVVIEACPGLADGLLQGCAPALPKGHPLLERYRPIIERTARRIHRFFGAPQDIEFAIEGGELFILQARPITRIDFAADVGEWTNADFRDGGVSCSVCSPLMWSLYDLIWESSLKGFLREIKLLDDDFVAGRMFFGRPYWNLGAVKRCLAKLPGFVEREFDTDLQVRIHYDGDGVRTPVSWLGLLRALPTALALKRFFRTQEAAATGMLARGVEALEANLAPLPRDLDAAFRQLIERDYFAVESCYFRTIFAASMAKLDFKESFPQADYAALVAGLPPLKHMAPLGALRRLKQRGGSDLTPMIEQFRHHGSRGLDIMHPRWDEDRAFVEELFATLPASHDNSGARRAYEAAHAEAINRLPRRRRPRFERKLARLRRFVYLREEMRDLSNRVYYLIRRAALELARRRGIGDDIFFMTFADIFADDRSQVEARRATCESYRHFAAPNEIGRSHRAELAQPCHATSSLQGIAVSHGVARGRAFVAHSAQEAMRAQAGDILVCPFTDPGWTTVLERVSAVVAETGGMLSHAAVICREYAIPAVLGVEGATQRVRHGQSITVDGTRGVVALDTGQ